jgi:hypothetical protein
MVWHSARFESRALRDMTWNNIRNFHQEPAVVAFWQKLLGPVLRWLTPERRRLLLGLSALVVALRFTREKLRKADDALGLAPDWFNVIAVAVLLLGFIWLCYVAAKNFTRLPGVVRRRPQICLHALLWLFLVWGWLCAPANLTTRTLLFGFVLALPFLVWRLGYMIMAGQHGRAANTRFTDHLAYIFPLWGGSNTPYGKGWEYLSANEAKDETELARSQLAGLKLLWLSALWSVAKDLLDWLAFDKHNVIAGTFGVPPLSYSQLFAQPVAYPLGLSWFALYLNLVSNVLGLASHGHRIIGWLRILGFNVFRNTYKPLLADTIVEFWNRYYYYFKELLVNFFFYPTFARRFKRQPRTRIFAAVFAAAFAGNIYYHWLGLGKTLVAGDFTGMWAALQSRFFYCFLLALGIWISMLRHQRAGLAPHYGKLRRAVAIFGVWTFFSLIHIWAARDPAPFFVRVNFFLRLFGLG